jgi:hypothetical protein
LQSLNHFLFLLRDEDVTCLFDWSLPKVTHPLRISRRMAEDSLAMKKVTVAKKPQSK